MEETQLETLRKELEYWQKHEPDNNMGQFARQTKIDFLKNYIKELDQSKTSDNSTTNNVIY